MRPLVLITVLLGGLFVSWRQGWIGEAFGAADETAGKIPRTLAEHVASRVDIERMRLGVPTLQVDAEMERWLLDAVKAGGKDPESLAQSARDAWPQYQDVRVMETSSIFDDTILKRVMEWGDVRAGELSHIAVVVRSGLCGMGSKVTVLAGLRYPAFTPEALEDPKQSKFYSVCTLCQRGESCQIPRQSRSFKLRCHECGQIYAMLASDTQGKFRYVTEFLTGYAPKVEISTAQGKLPELMEIWRAETQGCRYLTDGRKDNDDAWQTAEETRETRQGDCEDSAILLTDWLCARGFQARVAIGTYAGARGPHAWVVARLEGNDYVLESTEFPFALQRPPLVSELGRRYVPELLFDREALFVPQSQELAQKGDLWAEDAWRRVVTVRAKEPKGAQ